MNPENKAVEPEFRKPGARDRLTLFGALSSLAALVIAVLLRHELADQFAVVSRGEYGDVFFYWTLYLVTGFVGLLVMVVFLLDLWRTDRFEARDSHSSLSWSEKWRATLLVTALVFGVISVIRDEPINRLYGCVVWQFAAMTLALRNWTDYKRARARESGREEAAKQREWWRAFWSRWNPWRPRPRRSAADRFAIEWVWFVVSCVVATLWMLASSNESFGEAALLGIVLGIPLYIILGTVRLTIWSVRRVFYRAE